MKPGLTLMAMLLIVSAAARAQQNPAAPGTAGSAGLSVGGTLRYSLRYSDSANIGGSQGNQQQSFVSGDASYSGVSKSLPFSMQYGGGYGWTWPGSSGAGNIFQHLSLTQGLNWRRWSLNASDNVSYSFQTPTTGFNGVPGTGEPIGGSGSTTPTDQTILTVNTRTLDNSTTVGTGHRLDYATTLSFGGSVGEMIFIDGNGQNTNTVAANVGVSRRLDGRDSVSGGYSYSRFNYGQAAVSQTGLPQISYGQANSLQFSFSRQWTRKISSSGSIGPQWTSSSNSAIQPSSTRFSASASVQETFKVGSAGLTYSHGASGGAGLMQGSENDTLGANYSRGIGKKWNVGITGSYMRTAGLNGQGAVQGEYGGVQASRGLGRYFSIFANYTATNQSSGLSNAPNVLNSLSQVIGFGISYSPREYRIKK